MYNWSIDEQKMQKNNPVQFAIWQLEQAVNFGLAGQKISESQLRKHWADLQLDPDRRKFFEFILQS